MFDATLYFIFSISLLYIQLLYEIRSSTPCKLIPIGHQAKLLPNSVLLMFTVSIQDWGQILLRLTPAGGACCNKYVSAQTDMFHMFSWCKQNVLFFSQMLLSHNVFLDSYQYWRSSCFIFDFLKLNLCEHVFVSTFSFLHVNNYYFCFWHIHVSGKMCKNKNIKEWQFHLGGPLVYVAHVNVPSTHESNSHMWIVPSTCE